MQHMFGFSFPISVFGKQTSLLVSLVFFVCIPLFTTSVSANPSCAQDHPSVCWMPLHTNMQPPVSVLLPQKIKVGVVGVNATAEQIYTAFGLSPGYTTLYISYDGHAIAQNTEQAKILYYQEWYNKKNKQINYFIHPISATYKKTFLYKSGQPVLIISGAKVSTTSEDTIHLSPTDIPRYRHSHFPTERIGFLQKNIPDLTDEQHENFTTYLYTTNKYLKIDPVSGIISALKPRPIHFLIKNQRISNETALRTLRYFPFSGGKEKIQRNISKKTYISAFSQQEILLSSGDTLLQLTPNGKRDIDGLLSRPIERIDKVTACVKTKRMNMLAFGINIPYGGGAYTIAQKPHESKSLIHDALYLGQSTLPMGSVTGFDGTKDNRWELLDIQTFPSGTNLIEVTRHSTSPAGREYGHTNVGVIWANNLRFLDPYVNVPGYEPHELKLFDDFKRCDRAKNGLAVAKVHYYKGNFTLGPEF